jgi:predicted lipoprotein with Yx(FWY)xxD motif
LGVIALALAGGGVLAACSSTSSSSSSGTTTGSASKPGTEFHTAQVAGRGTVVVDARGRTVYILTADGKTNTECTGASGCTSLWPDLPLPDGTSAATAGAGIQASLLGTKKLADGETYPTYNGWLMYEYTGDSGPGQASGQGIRSFGGTWYTLSPAGSLMP